VCIVSTVGECGREKVLSLKGEATSIEGFRTRKLDLGRQWARTETEIDGKRVLNGELCTIPDNYGESRSEGEGSGRERRVTLGSRQRGVVSRDQW